MKLFVGKLDVFIFSYQGAEKYGRESSADKTFPRFFRRNFDQRRTTEKETENIRPYVVDYNHSHRNDEPIARDKSLFDVLISELRQEKTRRSFTISILRKYFE